MDHLNNSDISITYSHWKEENFDKFFIFPPLQLNTKLYGIQLKKNSEITRIDFELIENEEKIIFQDLHSGKKFHIDFSEVFNGKLHFFGESGKKETWDRIPIEQASNWM